MFTPDLGIYIHWPFCAALCPYCDFNSHVAATIDHPRWARAYAAEIARHRALAPGIVRSVYFGGGTPSLMAPETVAATLGAIRRAWPMVNDPEITLEANPTSVEAGRFRAFRDAGVNRVSIGIQALNDPDLRRLGRRHTASEARAAFDTARGAFDRVSFDLIYARQDQTPDDWRAELAEALAMAADHLSLYQLTIEDGTPFADRLARGGLRGLPGEDRAADLWDVTQELTAKHGLPAYEVSNHAREGAQSSHNLIYWRGGDYVGIGPGAHGRLTLGGTRHATEAPKPPGAWLHAAEAGTLPAPEPLYGGTVRDERLMMGLRLAEGLPVPEDAWGLGDRITALEDMGMVARSDSRLHLTEAGRPLLDAVLRYLLT